MCTLYDPTTAPLTSSSNISDPTLLCISLALYKSRSSSFSSSATASSFCTSSIVDPIQNRLNIPSHPPRLPKSPHIPYPALVALPRPSSVLQNHCVHVLRFFSILFIRNSSRAVATSFSNSSFRLSTAGVDETGTNSSSCRSSSDAAPRSAGVVSCSRVKFLV
jgi:hypothetical protein